MGHNWLSIKHIEEQELSIQKKTEDLFGKGRKGFCDFALDGLDLMIQGVIYMSDKEEFSDKDKWNNFKHALRVFSYYHYYRIIYTFKASYNLILQGYYTESAFLMRHIVETFVRLRYIAKEEKTDLVKWAWSGHRGLNNKKIHITYEAQFNDIAPGLYKYYRILCDITHGAWASHVLKTDVSNGKVDLDTGIVFKPENSTFVINQYSVYLLAHLEFMDWVFPEVKMKMTKLYAEKNHKTLTILWQFMKEVSESDRNKGWYDAVQHLVRI